MSTDLVTKPPAAMDFGAFSDLDPNALYIASLITDTSIKEQQKTLYEQLRGQMENANMPKHIIKQLFQWMEEATERHFSAGHMREMQARLLTMHYSVEELGELVAFYRSPIGRRHLVVQPKISLEAMTQILQIQFALMEEFQKWFEKVMRAELDKEKDY